MQTLYPSAFPEGVQFVRTFASSMGIHIGELPNGGYARINGTPIQDESEFDVLPPQYRAKALAWFAHRDDEVEVDDAPPVMWKRNELVYADTGEPLRSHAEIIRAFPQEGPAQRMALEWFGMRQQERYAVQAKAMVHEGRLIDAHTPDADAPMTLPEGPVPVEARQRGGFRKKDVSRL